MSEEEPQADGLDLKGKSTLDILAQIDLFSGLPSGHLPRVVYLGLEAPYRATDMVFP